MKVTKDKIESSQVYLTIEVEPAEVEEYMDAAYRQMVKKVNIPGFRKGKASRDVLERYIGKESLLEEALNNLVPETYEKAIAEQEIEPISQPQLEIAKTEPMVLKVVIPVKPTVELGEYSGIDIKAEPVQVTEVEVNNIIEELRHRSADWEPVERPVVIGDMLTIDVDSSIDGSSFINREGVQYQVRSGFPYPAPGFAEQLVDMTIDEEKEFALSFPEDFIRTELAGKTASFTVKIKEMKKENLPEINDDFARQIDPEWESMEQLRNQINTDLLSKAEDEARRDHEERVVTAVTELSKIEYPPVLVEEGINRLIDERLRQLQMADRGLDEYLKQVNKTEEEVREELRPMAVKQLTGSLVLEHVAEKENIEACEAEIDTEIQTLTSTMDESKKEDMGKFLNMAETRNQIKQMLITKNTVKRLVEIAETNSGGEESSAESD